MLSCKLICIYLLYCVQLTMGGPPRSTSTKENNQHNVTPEFEAERIFSLLRDERTRTQVLGFPNYKKSCGCIRTSSKDSAQYSKTSQLESHGITFTNDHITEIRWSLQSLNHNSIRWQLLPNFESLQTLDLRSNRISILFDDLLQFFPKDLRHLLLADNRIYGRQSQISCIDLTKLPSRLETLDLSQNKFHGPLYLSDLPMSMQRVKLSANKFYGHIVVETLPPGLEGLSLIGCWFSGSMNGRPPQALMDLDPYRFSV